jgi:sulfur carrier protein ThiS
MTSYFSLDGTNWNMLETATINMVDTVYVGLANCSHIDTAINDAVFDHIIINGKALSVNETVKDNLAMTVYPNPTQEQLTISLHQTDKGNNIALTVVDVNGNPVLKKQFKTSLSNSYSIDVNTLPIGTYFIEVQANKRMVSKFVKQ